MKPVIRPLKKSLLICIAALTFASCVTQKDLIYMRDKKEALEIFKDSEAPDYKLRANDELYITIKSLDDISTNVFMQSGQASNNINLSPYSASLMSYQIDSEGNMEVPVLGVIHAEDLTIPEVTSLMQDSLQYILSHPTVTVKLVNRYVTVLGEVANPGHYSYSKERFTIYDALGTAGDIMDFGNRHEVVLTRNEKGENRRYILDLSKPEMLSSELYYIRPNDMVYVKPMKKKFWDMRTFPYGFSIAFVSAALAVYSVIR